MAVTVGGVATLKWEDAPTDAMIALTVMRPDGATSSPTVTSSSATYTADLPGRHVLTWTAGNGERFVDILDVWPADPRYLISLDDALDAIKTRLREGKDAARDTLQIYIAATTWIIENITGPIISAELTHTTRRYNGRGIALPAPGQVTSVVAGGALVPAHAYEVDEDAGVIYLDLSPGIKVVLTYVVGSATIPANVRLAAREQVRFLWQVGQNGGRSGAMGPDLTTFTPEGFAVPRRVIELLQATTRLGGMA